MKNWEKALCIGGTVIALGAVAMIPTAEVEAAMAHPVNRLECNNQACAQSRATTSGSPHSSGTTVSAQARLYANSVRRSTSSTVTGSPGSSVIARTNFMTINRSTHVLESLGVVWSW